MSDFKAGDVVYIFENSFEEGRPFISKRIVADIFKDRKNLLKLHLCDPSNEYYHVWAWKEALYRSFEECKAALLKKVQALEEV